MGTRDDTTSRMLDVYEQPMLNSLTEQSYRAAQPPEIKLPLKPHQLAMIHAMEEREQTCIDGFTINGEIHHSQFAVLGDRVGSGKTLMMLGHLAQMKRRPVTNLFQRIHNYSKVGFWSSKPVCTQECSGNTLILVPHTLFHQWKHTIQTQTTLSFLEVRTTKVLDKGDFLTLIKQRDIVLMSNTALRHYMADLVRAKMQWKRIIFDEMDSVQFTSTLDIPPANFYWLMTATWPNFLFHGQYTYMSNGYLTERIPQLHRDLVSVLQQETLANSNNYFARYDVKSHNYFASFLTRHPNRGHLVLRSSDTFMEQSWKLPTIHDTRIICESPVAYRVVANFVTPEIQELLHAGDTQGALERLGVGSETKSSLVEAVTEVREKELDRMRKELTFRESMEYATPQAKELALAARRAKITSLENQISALKERITNAQNEICAICFEEPKVPTFVMCCNRLYCGACLMNWLQRSQTCALCRQPVNNKTIKKLSATDSPKGKAKDVFVPIRKPKKKEALLDTIKQNKDGRFLVFNRYDNPFTEIEGELTQLGFRVAVVRGNKDHISKILSQFEKGEIQILLMNSTQAGVGMDLKSATHIVLMHAMRKEEEKQIIGRAVRLGRIAPLNLVRLLHEEEQALY